MWKQSASEPLILRKGERRQEKLGFTLVEILVVIGIIGLLAALLITATLSALSRSKRAKTKALIKKLETGLRNYETDFQQIPEPAATLKVRMNQEWVNINYPDSLNGQSAQLHGLLGAKIQKVKSVDPATGATTYTDAGPYVNFQKHEIKGEEKGNYKKPIIDAWENVLRVRFNGWDHSSNPSCGSRDNEEWVDIWSEGPRIEDDVDNGCNKDDINNFGKKNDK